MKKRSTEFGVKLQNIMTALGLTQKELAQELVVHEVNVNRWVNGHHHPLGAFMEKIDVIAERAKYVLANQKKYNLPYHTVRCGLCLAYVKTKSGKHDTRENRILCKGCHDTINFK